MRIVIAAVAAMTVAGCTMAEQRATTGGVVGAGTGAIIGGLTTGRPGGALAGAAIGGATGAIVGAATTPAGPPAYYGPPVAPGYYGPRCWWRPTFWGPRRVCEAW